MASAGAAIGWDQLHTEVVTQGTAWVSPGEAGYDNLIFYSVGAKVEVDAYFYWWNKNRIAVDLYGRKNLGDSKTDGYKHLEVTGSHAIAGGWSYNEWTKLWYDGSGISSSDDTQTNRCDFWVLSVSGLEGDQREYRVQTVDLRCFPKGTFNSYSAQCGDTIKGRGWYTDHWWSMAMIDRTWTGTEGAPINASGWGSMPRFSSTAIALSYATSWTGTYITPATADACHPSLQTF